jgi:RNA polymerase sigma-70 factor (ECF subfamily)
LGTIKSYLFRGNPRLKKTLNSEPEARLESGRLHEYIQRWQAGDRSAGDALIQAVGDRLEHITRKMLRAFPAVRARAETADVLQRALMRLLVTLSRMKPESTRHFFNLAAVHVRLELLDLARYFRKEPYLPPSSASGTEEEAPRDPAERPDEDLDLWCRFHEAVEQLPAEEREVVGLVFYHGWTQARIAELFQVNERTIRRRWQGACLRLQQLIGEKIPNPLPRFSPAGAAPPG